MVFKGLIAATAAVTLAAAPAMAARTTATVAPASESVSGSQQMSSTGWLIAAFAILAVIGGVVAASSGSDGQAAPVSP